MKSPHQIRFKSSPKTVTLVGGGKLSSPMASGRKTPTVKTAAKIYSSNAR